MKIQITISAYLTFNYMAAKSFTFAFPLLQMEQENQQLKMANLKQTEQIMLLQDKLQGEYCCRRLDNRTINYTAK